MSVWRDQIWVKPGGEVIILRQDIHTGKLTELPLTVNDGKVYAMEPQKKAPAKDINAPTTYDLLYEEGGAGTT